MKNPFLFTLLLILVAVANSANAADSINPLTLGKVTSQNFITELDIKWSGGLPLVEVMIDGETYLFLFDTAAPTVIPTYLVNKLKLKPVESKFTVNDSAGYQSEVKIYTLPALHLGNIKFSNFTVIADDFANHFPTSCLGFVGIIGYNFLQDLVVKLELTNNKITLSDKPISHDGFIATQIEFATMRGPVIRLQFAFGQGWLELDTGKNEAITIGDPSIIPEFENQGYSSRKTVGTFSQSFSGAADSEETTYLVKEFTIDEKLPIKTFPISVDNSGAFLIGNKFLKKFTIIIDFVNKTAYFKPISSSDINENYNDTFGFTPFWDKDKGLFISAITEKTPAHHSGLAIGDQIIMLNGEDMRDFTANDFCKLILKRSGSQKSYDDQQKLTLSVKKVKGNETNFSLKK